MNNIIITQVSAAAISPIITDPRADKACSTRLWADGNLHCDCELPEKDLGMLG